MRSDRFSWWMAPALAVGLTGCGGDDGGGGTTAEADMGQAAASFTCDEALRRAVPDQPAPADGYTCAAEPAAVQLTDTRGRTFEVFAHEASHPLADADEAFPCAAYAPADGQALIGVMKAPAAAAGACSTAGVRPWHSVPWADAKAACERIGWRLCAGDELLRACQGPNGTAYAYGSTFDGGACNFRESYTAPGASGPSEAPTGALAECTAGEGVFDANGNLWEWTADRDANDDRTRFYQGAGWKTIAERHRDTDQVCEVTSRIPGLSAASFASESVGFRCCRDVP